MDTCISDHASVPPFLEFLNLLFDGPVTKEVFGRYSPWLERATAGDVNDVLHEALSTAEDIEAWKLPVARFIRSASRGLDSQILPDYPPDGLFSRLEEENRAIERALAALQKAVESVRKGDAGFAMLGEPIERLGILRSHYEALQNELFPLFELASPRHACVKLMWAMQDDVLRLLDSLRLSLSDSSLLDEKDFWNKLGGFYLNAASLVYRERRILFPAAFQTIPAEAFLGNAAPSGPFRTSTGALEASELEAIFSALPVDISFVGADDRLKFFSDPPDRIFPRSPASLGRLVENCHPPKSLDKVKAIIESFKKGERDTAEFWLQARGKFVHISYKALRDQAGIYLGTLEISQDISRLSNLEGEKRLL